MKSQEELGSCKRSWISQKALQRRGRGRRKESFRVSSLASKFGVDVVDESKALKALQRRERRRRKESFRYEES